jgi:hypothetical protein
MAAKNQSGNGSDMGAYAEDDVSRKRLKKEQGVSLKEKMDSRIIKWIYTHSVHSLQHLTHFCRKWR